LARRYQRLSDEIDDLDAAIGGIVRQVNPALLAAEGVGIGAASTLLVAAGDNPERMRSEASFAALCGVSPVEASSGKVVRHRLNRGGNRNANNALWCVAFMRMRYCDRTKRYAAKRRAEGKSDREIIRCLMRYIAREMFRLVVNPPAVPSGPDLRSIRTAAKITLPQVAEALGTHPTRISELERGKRHNNDLATKHDAWLEPKITT